MFWRFKRVMRHYRPAPEPKLNIYVETPGDRPAPEPKLNNGRFWASWEVFRKMTLKKHKRQIMNLQLVANENEDSSIDIFSVNHVTKDISSKTITKKEFSDGVIKELLNLSLNKEKDNDTLN